MTGLTRRRVIMGAAGIGGAALMPRWLHASIEIGGWQIDTLSDGNLVLPAEFILGPMPAHEIAPILARHGVDPGAALTPPCNVTLLRGQGRVVLFDAGSGLGFQPTAGDLPDALMALGVAPEDVTDVVFTHGHPDHLWGALDDFDEALFFNARHAMGAGEIDYWRDPDTVGSIGAARQSFAIGAARRLEMLGDRVETFSDGTEVMPGVTAVMTPGHTPGHMSFAVAGPGGAVMILGDAIGNAHVGFEAPLLPTGSDQDMAMAADTRGRLLDRVVADDMRVIGFHLPAGGIGRVERSGDAYRFLPDA